MNKQVEEYIAKRKAEAYPRTLGLWKNEHGRLISSPLRKSDIPPHTRLMFLKNRKKEKGDRQPDYIGYFVQGSKEDAQGIEAPFIALKNLANEKMNTNCQGCLYWTGKCKLPKGLDCPEKKEEQK